MIEKKYFVIQFITRSETSFFKVPYKFEEASFRLNEFINRVKKPKYDYWINHKLVYHNNILIHQFDIFENNISVEYLHLKNYTDFINSTS